MLYGYEAAAAPTTSPKNPEVFFDAQHVGVDKEGYRQTFDGEVVAMAAGTLILADHIELDRGQQTFEASGNVLLVSSQQVFTGKELRYDLENGDFTLTEALLTANSEEEVKKIVEGVLGISAQEIEFEVNRTLWAKKIETEKAFVKKEYLQKADLLTSAEKEARIEQYEILLKEEAGVKGQENAAHFGIYANRFKQLQRRRQFWRESQEKALTSHSNVLRMGYFRLAGDRIERLNQYEIKTTKGYLTPCLCEKGETPAWAFRSENIDATVEGYADLYNPILELKGIPILYVPYLRIPTKSERQSGFSIPSLSYNSLNGNIFSESLFLDLGLNQDATVSMDFFQKRGLRLGVEYRHQLGTYSGWTAQMEGLQDRSFMNETAIRSDIFSTYEKGFAIAKTQYDAMTPTEKTQVNTQALDIKNPGWWAGNPQFLNCLNQAGDATGCIQKALQPLRGSSQSNRGKVQWSGQTFFAPRWSFISTGSFFSDHRYTQDLYFGNVIDAFSPLDPQRFSKIKAASHLDAENFYLGVGSNWGDSMLASQRISGYQNPLYMKWQSRLFSLLPDSLSRPLYAQGDVSIRKMISTPDSSFTAQLANGGERFSLGGGDWQRFRIQFLSPLVTDQFFLLDYFTTLEYRNINAPLQKMDIPFSAPHNPLSLSNTRNSYIQTARYGLNLSIPMDGRVKLYSEPESQASHLLEHRMNWMLTLSMRPVVMRRGVYGEYCSQYTSDIHGVLQGNDPLVTYFPSDLKKNIGADILPEQEFMYPHEKLILSTSHDWMLFNETWSFTPRTKSQGEPSTLSYREQAEHELTLELDNSIHATHDLYDPIHKTWGTNRYGLQRVNESTPLNFQADIDYDWEKVKQRGEQLRLNPSISSAELVQPWSELRSNLTGNWNDWHTGFRNRYNFYTHTGVESTFTLTPPTLASTTFTLGLMIEQNVIPDPADVGFSRQRIFTRTYDIRSTLIPYIETLLSFGDRTLYNEVLSYKSRTSVAAQYMSPARCWGVKFSWVKEYTDINWSGTYFAALVIRFFNYDREFGNLANRWNGNNNTPG